MSLYVYTLSAVFLDRAHSPPSFYAPAYHSFSAHSSVIYSYQSFYALAFIIYSYHSFCIRLGTRPEAGKFANGMSFYELDADGKICYVHARLPSWIILSRLRALRLVT